jgi:hypothetical protein
VPQRALSDSAGVLVNYILGIAGQNAANARALASSKMDRSAFLAGIDLILAGIETVNRAGQDSC